MNQKGIRLLLQIVIWVLIYLLPYFIAYGEINLKVLFDKGGDVHAVSTALLIAYTYLNYQLLVPKFYLHRKYILYSLSAVFCLLLVIWFPNILDAGGPPERRGPTGDGPPGDGPQKNGPPMSFLFGPSYNTILFIISTLGAIGLHLRLQLVEMQKEKLDAELSFLKAQINPHFLFNTLNSIYSLAIQKSDDTPKAIIQLSDLMRYILKDSDVTYVELENELAYINNYIALQKRRLGDTVAIDFSAPLKTIGYKIAPLLLMSFIENAFKHGVNPDEDSKISITITAEDDKLMLHVINNKVNSIGREEAMGIGLKNATSRLEHLYPAKHQLLVDDGATTFSVKLIIDLHD